MNKTAIRAFATSARRELIEQVSLRAKELGVTETRCATPEVGPDYVVLGGMRFPKAYQRGYERLCAEWKRKGFHRLVEEVAYTWFNRIIAIRYMEIHDYLPSHVRILSSAQPGGRDPEVLTRYRELTFSVDIPLVEQALRSGDREAAYRHLLVGQCEELHRIMPFLFEPVADYTELLLPGRLLHADSVVQKLVREVSEEDFANVEIIGWMYQYYVSEKKDEVVGMNKGFVKPEDLPAATQLFTPHWIVKYMLENSLGRLWKESYGETDFTRQWEFYLTPRHSVPRHAGGLSLEEMRVFDPACGSGHILVYAFDLLYQMYEAQGYLSTDIPQLILEKNLYGLDIDARAAQLAGFALMMKAREKDRRIFARGVKLNVQDFRDACDVSDEAMALLCQTDEERKALRETMSAFSRAKLYGSLIVPTVDVTSILERLESLLHSGSSDLYEQSLLEELRERVLPVLQQAHWLNQKYDVVVTNPPYHNKYCPELKAFMQQYYKDYKADLYSAFIYRCTQLTKKGGFAELMTPFTWMFISSHEKLRRYILGNHTISSLVQLEYSAFEEATVPICTFVIQNQTEIRTGEYIRLADFRGAESQPVKVQEAARDPDVPFRYCCDQTNFFDIPGAPIAYWATDRVREIFREYPKLGEIAEPKVGLQTSDNDRFLRLWHEVDIHRIGFGMRSREEAQASGRKWFPLNKGGEFRKWYGNQDYVVNWEKDGEEIRHFTDGGKRVKSRPRNMEYYFREGITWTDISSSKFGVRYSPPGFISECTGNCVFPEPLHLRYLIGFMCSDVCFELLAFLNSTMHFLVGNIASLPIIIDEARKPEIDRLVQKCIQISKDDWDDFEVSWNFQVHPLVRLAHAGSLEKAFAEWEALAESRFRKLKENETAINDIFAEIYGLEARPVQDEDITIRRADRERDAKSFLSYFIGCLMGRYSLDYPRLTYAGGEWDPSRYQRFIPDADGIVPLTDEPYFEDDVMRRLEAFLTVLFGPETVAENMVWLAESIGELRANETPAQRIRRYLMDEFYKDHLKTYRKRPIYWLFESGGKKGFRALMYLHRYNRETLPRVRLQYVQALQRRYAQEVDVLTRQIESGMLSAAERRDANKRIKELEDRQLELAAYDQKLAALANDRIELNLDDGVVVNHAKLAAVLAPIK